jgi:type II secretory pathway pseudopilin PulG
MKTRSAFTLLEALIAILLVALVLPVALEAVTRSGQGAGLMRRQDRALRLAQSRLGQLIATGEWQTAAQSGTFTASEDGEDADGLRWELESGPWRDSLVTQLTLTVTWDPPTDWNRVGLTTLVTPPASSSETE